ncbi:hypothetical protein C6A85_08670, partial [Mycobacterium sp. ITM-2017-0098]
AQYLGPILDAIKFNYLPFGANQLQTAMTLPKQIAYSEPRLQPRFGVGDLLGQRHRGLQLVRAEGQIVELDGVQDRAEVLR